MLKLSENMDIFWIVDTKELEQGKIGFQLKGGKRWINCKIKDDSNGKYFIANKIKYYL